MYIDTSMLIDFLFPSSNAAECQWRKVQDMKYGRSGTLILVGSIKYQRLAVRPKMKDLETGVRKILMKTMRTWRFVFFP